MSIETIKKKAAQGEAWAQNTLGVFYCVGDGVPQDYNEALKCFRLAAEQGEEDAQFNLGRMYLLGYGVHQDMVTALAWYLLAADNGCVKAQEFLSTVETDMSVALTPEQIAEAKRLARELLKP